MKEGDSREWRKEKGRREGGRELQALRTVHSTSKEVDARRGRGDTHTHTHTHLQSQPSHSLTHAHTNNTAYIHTRATLVMYVYK